MNESSEFDEKLCKRNIKFKLDSTDLFLEKIPDNVPLQLESENRVKCEINIQCFLFFSVGALDLCYQNVNMQLSLGIIPHKFSFPKFREMLEEKQFSDIKAKLVLDELDKYTKYPSYETHSTTQDYAYQYAEEYFGGNMGLEFWCRFENQNENWLEHIWNRKNSSLWELRKLRNDVTHGSILKQSREQNNSSARDGIHVPLRHDIKNFRDQFFVLNPKQYFKNSLRDINRHVDEIIRILE